MIITLLKNLLTFTKADFVLILLIFYLTCSLWSYFGCVSFQPNGLPTNIWEHFCWFNYLSWFFFLTSSAGKMVHELHSVWLSDKTHHLSFPKTSSISGARSMKRARWQDRKLARLKTPIDLSIFTSNHSLRPAQQIPKCASVLSPHVHPLPIAFDEAIIIFRLDYCTTPLFCLCVFLLFSFSSSFNTNKAGYSPLCKIIYGTNSYSL